MFSLRTMWYKIIQIFNSLRRLVLEISSFDDYHKFRAAAGVHKLFVGGVFVAYDDVIKWKHLPRYWHFVMGIHR